MPRLDQRLVDAAICFANQRFPGDGEEGAAAMYLDDGAIVVSTAIAVLNEAVALCHETGALCEAYARGRRVEATVCVGRLATGKFMILTACGVCQERLWYWGSDVEVAVPRAGDAGCWESRRLGELSPHYWRTVFSRGSPVRG